MRKNLQAEEVRSVCACGKVTEVCKPFTYLNSVAGTIEASDIRRPLVLWVCSARVHDVDEVCEEGKHICLFKTFLCDSMGLRGRSTKWRNRKSLNATVRNDGTKFRDP